jgi:hypothetical protein
MITSFLKFIVTFVRAVAQLQTSVGGNLLQDGRAVAVHQLQRLRKQVQLRDGPANVLAVLFEYGQVLLLIVDASRASTMSRSAIAKCLYQISRTID